MRHSVATLSKEKLDETQDGLADILRTEEGLNELERGIDDLTDSALAVERNFRDVADGFRETEKILRAEPHHSDLVEMRKRWATYQKDYKRLLRRSREVAGKAHATILDFVRNILYVVALPDAEMSLEAKKVELDAYTKKLEADQSSPQTDLADGFESLKEKIFSFQSDFNALLEDFRNRIPDCEDQIRTNVGLIGETLKSIERADFWKLACLKCASVVGIVPTFLWAVGIISPVILWKALAAAGVVALVGVGLGVVEYKKRGSLERMLISVKELRDVPNQLAKAVAALPDLDKKMADIAQRLGLFQSVWVIIKCELLEIQNLMESVESSVSDVLLRRRIANVEHISKALAQALRRFQITINTN